MISTVKTFDCRAGRMTVNLSDDPDKPVTFVRHDSLYGWVQERDRTYLKAWARQVRRGPNFYSADPQASEWAFIAEQLAAEGVL